MDIQEELLVCLEGMAKLGVRRPESIILREGAPTGERLAAPALQDTDYKRAFFKGPKAGDMRLITRCPGKSGSSLSWGFISKLLR
jgi:hypothetical protein